MICGLKLGDWHFFFMVKRVIQTDRQTDKNTDYRLKRHRDCFSEKEERMYGYLYSYFERSSVQRSKSSNNIITCLSTYLIKCKMDGLLVGLVN